MGEVVLPPVDQFGFCEGVVAADDLLERVAQEAKQYGLPVYGYHEIVHNREVAEKHEATGVRFVNALDDIPPNSLVVTSAHGVGPLVGLELAEKGCEQFDAACPLVLATHNGIKAAREHSEKVLYVCHNSPYKKGKTHDEVKGALGHINGFIEEDRKYVEATVEHSFIELGEPFEELPDILSAGERYVFITQTTLNDLDCLAYQAKVGEFIRNRQPEANLRKLDRTSVCTAVRNRSMGVTALLADPTRRPDRMVVVTDPTSSNGVGYADQASRYIAGQKLATKLILVATAAEVTDLSTDGITAITASASTPDSTTKAVAIAFGAQGEDLAWQRRMFALRDADTQSIQRRIAAHVARQAA